MACIRADRLAYVWVVLVFSFGCSRPTRNAPDASKVAPQQVPADPWILQRAFELDANDLAVMQAMPPPKIDGRLQDWKLVRWVMVDRQPGFLAKGFSATDLTVRVAFAFDVKCLYLAVDATDDRMVFPQRAWRYGDGFMITFGNSQAGPASQRFVTLGFSTTSKGKPKVRVVNRDGVFFPQESIDDVRFQVVINSSAHKIQYEAAIPWKHLRPLQPLLHRHWGVNLTYTDRDGGRRKRVQLVADPNADTEQTRWRRIRPARFVVRPAQSLQCQAAFSTTFAMIGDTLSVRLGCLFPPGHKPYRLRVTVHSGKKTIAQSKELPMVVPKRVVKTKQFIRIGPGKHGVG